jgi:hypothetical protein
MNILDHIFESLEQNVWVKILKLFDAVADPGIFLTLGPGSWMGKIRMRDKLSGTATLHPSRYYCIIFFGKFT